MTHSERSPKTTGQHTTLWIITVAKFQLQSSDKNNFMVGGQHNIRNCVRKVESCRSKTWERMDRLARGEQTDKEASFFHVHIGFQQKVCPRLRVCL